jgi:predicted amidophosphoribosyltransferase
VDSAGGAVGVGQAGRVTGRVGAVASLVAAVRDLARLVLPVECPGCGAPDEVLCGPCAAVLDGPACRCEADVPRLDPMNGLPPLPVWAVASYTGPLRGVVVAWKDRGRRDLTAHLVAAARRAGREVGAALGSSSGGRWSGGSLFGGPVRVVPVPTTNRARRRRGADLVARLALAVAEGLVDAGVPAERAAVLRRRAAADQVGLGGRDRGRNAARVTLRGDPGYRLHLLVDDVVTTGATLAACCRAIERAGGPVLGAVVIAATPPPRPRKDPTRNVG